MRLAFLIKWCSATVSNARTPQERREAFVKMRRWHKLKDAQCWVCERIARLVRHHIIQIQNGGNNEGANLVTICDWCHAEVHPWLDAPNDHPIVVAVKELESAPF
jgi:5-methylcytosine-specific restriction endonuclease McrA